MTAPDGFPLDSLHGTADGDGFASAAVGSVRVGRASAQAGAHSVAYTVPCPTDFAGRVRTLAERRGTEPAAVAAASLLIVGAGGAAVADPGPGEPSTALELRLPPGLDDGTIRRALALALALAEGGVVPAAQAERLAARVETLEYRNKALSNALERLSFQPLDGGLREVRDAALLFGFVNEWCFDEDRVIRRFRELAPVYHPDTGMVGCRERMAQLIEARNLLVRHVRTAYANGAWRRKR